MSTMAEIFDKSIMRDMFLSFAKEYAFRVTESANFSAHPLKFDQFGLVIEGINMPLYHSHGNSVITDVYFSDGSTSIL